MTRWVSPDGAMDLRLGDWRDVLADVGSCDAVVTDPPYSIHTHSGNSGLGDRFEGRSDLGGYEWIDREWVRGFAEWSTGVSRGWVAAMTDDFLAWSYREALSDCGFLSFATVSVIQHRPRLVGDGPGSCTVHLQVARPRRREFLSWGSLPGWYKSSPDKTGIVNGGKPLALMRAIVRDYSRPGDLIVDPCAGGGTTLLAAAMEGRRAIGAEIDPATYAKAVERLRGLGTHDPEGQRNLFGAGL